MTNREFDELRQDKEEWIWGTDPIECTEIECGEFNSAITDADNDLITFKCTHSFAFTCDSIVILIPKTFDDAIAARLIQKLADTLKRSGSTVLNLEPGTRDMGFRMSDGTLQVCSWLEWLRQTGILPPNDAE